MIATSTMVQYVLLLVFSASAIQVMVAAEEIQVVSVPLDEPQTQNFLNNERQQIESESDDLKSMDAKINEETSPEEIEKLAEYMLSDVIKKSDFKVNEAFSSSSSSEVLTTFKRKSSDEENEDVWIIEMSPDAKITQYFLNNERKYADDTNEELMFESSTRTTDANEVSVDEVGVDVVQMMEMEENPHIDFTKSFLYEEKLRSEIDNSPFQSLEFKTKSSSKISTRDVDVCGTVNLNKIVDEVLNDLRKDIVDRGLDKVKIPDIHESFKKNVGIMTVTGDFKAEDGWAKNLSTIQRTADVIASAEGNSLTIACGFGLTDLEFGYDKYKAKFINLGPTGTLHAIVAQNSVILNATVFWKNHTCTTTLNYLRLNQLGGLKLKITGLGPLNFLVTKISDWAFKRFHEQIKEKIETTLTELMKEQLKTFDCMKYMLKWTVLS